MTVFIPRTRTISLRLSDEEFAALERYCVSSGARSISDFARQAICGLISPLNQENVLVSTVNEHSALVKDLEQKIAQLTAEIALLKTGKQAPAGGEASGAGAREGIPDARD